MMLKKYYQIRVLKTPKYLNILCQILNPAYKNQLKKNFENIKIDRCYFHFFKLLWNKAKHLGLVYKTNIKNNKIILFILKIIPFLDIDYKNDIFEKLGNIYYSKEDKDDNDLNHTTLLPPET